MVATFCHNVARGLDIQVNDPDVELTLCYIDDVLEEFFKALNHTQLYRVIIVLCL